MSQVRIAVLDYVLVAIFNKRSHLPAGLYKILQFLNIECSSKRHWTNCSREPSRTKF